MTRLTAAVLTVAILIVAIVQTGPSPTRGQEPPTPRGQLGGPPSLQMTPPVPPQVPTPIASPSPLPTPSPTSVPPPTPVPASVSATATTDPIPSEMRVEDVVARIGPAVVTVLATQGGAGSGTPIAAVGDTGSGFFLDAAGHVVTAAEVVAGANAVEVVLADGERRPATLVATDPLTDLAVLRVDGAVPATAPLAAAAPQPGQSVLAFGTPLDTLPNSVSQGIVAATGRGLVDGPLAAGLIQHDAAVSVGFAGGPVVALSGEVVGVTTRATGRTLPEPMLGLPGIDVPDVPIVGIDPSPPGANAATSGLSFAVPAATIARVAAALIADGRVAYPFFGASVQSVTPEVAAALGLPTVEGALVAELLPDGPAALAGIVAGDIVLALDGERITPQQSFGSLLFARVAGQTVEITVGRGGDELRIAVVLGERPED